MCHTQSCHHRVSADVSLCRWTPSQALPSPLDAASLLTLSKPKEVWHMPLADVVADRSDVQHMDVELTATGEVQTMC